MPTFRITAPDGKTYDVTGPEGSTADQALEKVKASVARCLRTPPQGANLEDLVRISRTAIRQREHNP